MYSLALRCPKLRFLCMLRCCSLPLWNLVSNCILPFFQVRNHHDPLFRVGCCLGLRISALKEKKNLTTISRDHDLSLDYLQSLKPFLLIFMASEIFTFERTNERMNKMKWIVNVITALFHIILKVINFSHYILTADWLFPVPLTVSSARSLSGAYSCIWRMATISCNRAKRVVSVTDSPVVYS